VVEKLAKTGDKTGFIHQDLLAFYCDLSPLKKQTSGYHMLDSIH